MPRIMAQCAVAFGQEVDHAIGIAKATEGAQIPVSPGSDIYRPLHHTRIEHIYELAYLRLFCSWESFLEASFVRYLCGQHSRRHGQATMVVGAYHRTLVDAELAMLSGLDYFLWANTGKVLAMVRRHVTNGRHELVIAGSRGQLDGYAAIRHRIAHEQKDAVRKFDNTAMTLAGQRFGSKAGRFLRAVDGNVMPPLRWIESIGATLKNLATAIA